VLDNCINAALCSTFHVDRAHVLQLREYFNVPLLATAIDRRRQKFMDRFLGLVDVIPIEL